MFVRLDTTCPGHGGILISSTPPISHTGLVVVRRLSLSLSPAQPALVVLRIEALLGVHHGHQLVTLVDSMEKRNNPVLCGNQMNWLLLQLPQPGGKDFRTVNGGRKKYKIHMARKKNHRLFPNGTPVPVIDIVAFIKYYGIQAVKAECCSNPQCLCGRVMLEEEIAENLRRHDDYVGIRLVLQVSRHDTDTWKHPFQVVEFLIREGLDRGCIEDTTTFRKTVGNLVLTYKGFSRAGFRCHEDVLITADGGYGMLLKGVKGELDVHSKLLGHGATGLSWFHDI